MINRDTVGKIAYDLRELGIQNGDIILVHSSLKSLGHVDGGPETVIRGMLKALGDDGTLLMPALSYGQIPHHIHDSRKTASNVGTIPEFFRKREGTLRSLHPTHSVCGIGKLASRLLESHHLDRTPCGSCSPFNKMIDMEAKILMLGCGLRPNTTMHALEEYEVPPYLFGGDCVYTITDLEGNTRRVKYRTHGFRGWKQRYDRVADLPTDSIIRSGNVLKAQSHLLNTQELKAAVLEKMREIPCFFVDNMS